MDREFHFNKIIVLESLMDDEIKTGENLFNDLLKWKSLEIEGLHSEFKRILNRNDFFEQIKHLKKEVQDEDILPILHLEFHGDQEKKGLTLVNGELINWTELVNTFREINILSKNNFVVSLASCYGFYMNSAVKLKEKAPFWGFIGATKEISSGDIEISFESFFKTLLSTLDFNLSVKNLNETNGMEYRYAFYQAEEYFNFIFKKHEDEYYKPENFKQWVSTLVELAESDESIINSFNKVEILDRVEEILSDKTKIRAFFKNNFLNVNEN